MAFSLLANCDLDSVFSITIPDGACFSLTPVSTLFTFCPPAPPLLKVSHEMSDGLILMSIESSTEG